MVSVYLTPPLECLFRTEEAEAIIQKYAQEVILCPTRPNEWHAIAEEFARRWQVHYLIRRLDGKHVAIKCTKNGGSIFYNYRGYHSIILMVLVNGDYKFSWVNVGANGSASDCQVFNSCKMKKAIKDGTIGFPDPEPHPDAFFFSLLISFFWGAGGRKECEFVSSMYIQC